VPDKETTQSIIGGSFLDELDHLHL
jgi:hypothetical protein